MTSANTFYKEILIPPFLNPASISDLLKQFDQLEKENVSFVVFKGNEDVFCDGLDLKWVVGNKRGDYKKEMNDYGLFLKKIQTSSFISIALVKGSVSGGGMGIVCACDYVIADEKSNFSLPEGLFGLIPGMIMPALLNRLSPHRIKNMVFTGKKYESKAAIDFGIVDEVVTTTDFESSLAKAINTMRSCKKGSVADLKQLLFMSNVSKDELSRSGMDILSARLNDPEIRDRLNAIADFMEDN
jgi:enoyl-CoA hydratase/carnithine racemase